MFNFKKISKFKYVVIEQDKINNKTTIYSFTQIILFLELIRKYSNNIIYECFSVSMFFFSKTND